MQLIIALILTPVAVLSVVYALASFDLFFKFQEEGTASPTVRGESLNDIIASWRGRYLNRPGFPGFDPTQRHHEVLSCDPENPPDPYNSAILNWLAKKWGIFYVGLWPFVQVLWRTFEWTESRVNEKGVSVDWTRKEPTNFIYLKRFTYRFVLQAAEESTNKPIDLHFALTVECNNPRLAFFEITDWLTQLSVDAYDLARAFVGARSFEEIRSPKGKITKTASDAFAKWMLKLNKTLPSKGIGAPEAYGITITDGDLLEIALTGSNAKALAEATQAVGIAQAHADALVVTAKGKAEAVRIEGQAQADAIKVVYDEIDRHPETGVPVRQAEAMERAAANGATVVFGGGNATPFINVPPPTRNGPTPPAPAPTPPPVTPGPT